MSRVEVLLPVRRFEVLVTYRIRRTVSLQSRSTSSLPSWRGLPRSKVSRRTSASRGDFDPLHDLLSMGALEISTDARMAVRTNAQRGGRLANPKAKWETAFATGVAPPPESIFPMQETVSGAVFRAVPRQPDFRPGLGRLPQDPDLPGVDDGARSALRAHRRGSQPTIAGQER